MWRERLGSGKRAGAGAPADCSAHRCRLRELEDIRLQWHAGVGARRYYGPPTQQAPFKHRLARHGIPVQPQIRGVLVKCAFGRHPAAVSFCQNSGVTATEERLHA